MDKLIKEKELLLVLFEKMKKVKINKRYFTLIGKYVKKYNNI